MIGGLIVIVHIVIFLVREYYFYQDTYKPLNLIMHMTLVLIRLREVKKSTVNNLPLLLTSSMMILTNPPKITIIVHGVLMVLWRE